MNPFLSPNSFFQGGLSGKRPFQTKFFGAEKISWTIRAADPLSPEDKTQQSEIAAQALFSMPQFGKKEKGFEYRGHCVYITYVYIQKMYIYIYIHTYLHTYH